MERYDTLHYKNLVKINNLCLDKMQKHCDKVELLTDNQFKYYHILSKRMCKERINTIVGG